MKKRAVSTVLGFFSEPATAENRYQEIRSEHVGRVYLCTETVTRGRPPAGRYCDLRLAGESLVTVEVGMSDVGAVVHRLRKAGSPAIFTSREFEEIPVLPPDRPEPLTPERLREFIADRARHHGPPGAPGESESLLARLRDSEQAIEDARYHLIEAARLGHTVTAAAEWLLDNYFLTRTHAAAVRRHLPRDYRRILPHLRSHQGNLRIAELAREVVRKTDHVLNEAAIVDSVRAYQTVEPLFTAELWAYPLLLELALLEGLAGLAVHVSEAQQVREAAYLWANRLAASARQGAEAFQKIVRLMEAERIVLLPYFVACLAEQLQGDENAFIPVQRWIEGHLQSALSQLVAGEHIREARERVSISNIFRSLRCLSQIDYTVIFEEVSLVHGRLAEDPSRIYGRSSFATRDQCRRVVEGLSRCSGRAELDVASTAVRLASAGAGFPGVTWYLLGDGIALLEAELHSRPPLRHRFKRAVRRHALPVYLGSIGFLTASFVCIAATLALAAGETHLWVVGGLAALGTFVLSELSVQVVNALVVSLLPPDMLPRMDYRAGIPEEDATLVVVPMMLAGADTVRLEIEKLEVRFLANQDDYLFFSLFADFMDSDSPSAPTDAELLQAAQDGIDDLNKRYPGGRFLLFHRARVWSESEQRWIGWERKRGKLEELNAFLCGEGRADILSRGRLPIPVRYVITLDSDTQLPAGAARTMIATIAHPLNRVEIDSRTRTRRRGFTIIQPRVSITLPSANASRFTRIFADSTGIDPYCEAVSNAQQDLFGEASFHGKAIYDVRAFHTILQGRFPPEALLSHDLIEGAHVGVGLASDIELIESMPQNYAAFSQRERRWIRGDWQIAPWMLPSVPGADGGSVPNPLSVLNRWRIFDNLRRSMVPPASLALLLMAWLISVAPGLWTLVVALAFAMPALVPLLDRAALHVGGSARGWAGASKELARALVSISLLPHQAWMAVDAAARVIYRRRISRRNLLEWHTAALTEAPGQNLSPTLRQLLLLSGCSAVLTAAVLLRRVDLASRTVAFCWILAPALIVWLDGAAAAGSRARITAEEDVLYLRRIARRSWRYFDDLVSESSHWLPPDNTQLALRIEVAQRTSPTNIGLWLVSALSAFDFGFLTGEELAARCSSTMATLDGLEHYEGHLLNWYDTNTLKPLEPRYVSTVDSGNLLASLWVLEQGCKDVAASPLVGEGCLPGLADTLTFLTAASGSDSSAAAPLRELRRLIGGQVQGYELIGRLRLAAVVARQLADQEGWLAGQADEWSYWAGCLHREIGAWIAMLDGYLSWMEELTRPPDSFLRVLGEGPVKLRRRALESIPSLQDLANGAVAPVNTLLGMRRVSGLPPRVAGWLDQVAAEYERGQTAAARLVEKLQALADKAAALARGMQMRFLFDEKTRLFAIGYAVGGPVDFSSHYDLLASEARLASLVAIAKGDAPVAHWFTLGRPRASSPSGDILLSWSGAMFEYLMPLLFTRTFANSLLDEACRRAVKLHIRYGRERGVPWGISESAYSALDASQIYQYRAFGVPGLGLKPGLEDDLVVAPYATMLALMVDPAAAVSNLKALEEINLGGPLGFYESIDFSRENSPEGERGVVVYNEMAHHQGMSLVAVANTLLGDIMQRRFHANLRVRAVESLLFERVPVSSPLEEAAAAPVLTQQATEEDEPAGLDWTAASAMPVVHLQGNEQYSLMVTNSGGGYSRFGDFDLTRWRPDTTLDSWGTFIYVRDVRSGRAWSTTYHPVGSHAGRFSAHFAADRAKFHRHVLGIETVMEVTVAPDDHVELRRVAITNRLLRTRQIELTSFAELALAPHNADRAHPAFAKMFVETECLNGRVLIAHRRPRSPDEPQIWTAHLMTGNTDACQFETDRREFVGRGHTSASPDALWRNLTGSQGAVLDPAFSLRCQFLLDPRERREISFLTLAETSREALLALIAKYEPAESVTRAFEMAWTRAQLELRYLGIGPSAAQRYQELASHLLYPNPRMRPPGDRLSRNRLGQSRLWSYGISGDLPIATVAIAEPRGLPLVREMLLAHTFWRMRGFRADLVILDQETPHYDQPLRAQLERLIRAHALQAGTDRPGGVFLKDWNSMPEEDRTVILSASEVVLYGGRGSLRQQLVSGPEPFQPPAFVPADEPVREGPSQPLPFLELPYFNGIGGFTSDGREYAIYLGPDGVTPAPWVNVIANPGFGTIVSESGLGFTWCGNSQANRLTPWHNDPVSDPQSEVIYLRDEDSGAIWTPTPLPIRESDAYRARHGQGYSVYEHNGHAIGQELTVFVPSPAENADPVKICRLRLRNDSAVRRRLTVTYFAEWVLGTDREDHQMHVETSWDDAAGALLARNSWNTTYSGSVAFLAANPRPASHSGDRGQFLDRNGSVARPAALGLTALDNRTGAGLDPAAVVQVAVGLEPGQQEEVTFLLGQAGGIDQVRELLGRYRTAGQVEAALAQCRSTWEERLGALTVHTPILSVDLLLNRWLLYQTLSCRVWGRSGYYQSGGAFGFRDQLQDSMGLLYSLPGLARSHILAAAARQFVEGDVQHWWHHDTGSGVRTECSDDLVWLPYVVAHYVEVTGDTGILDAQAPFLEGQPLAEGEHERLFTPAVSPAAASVYEHCRLALDRAWRLGPHGLPLMGSGDWNDGMNRVGVGGTGESVWLAWFLRATCMAFAALAESRDPDTARRLQQRAEQLDGAVAQSSWDGEWYLRGFFDDGSPLGSRSNSEAQIDSLPQSWAVLANSGDPARARQALDACRRLLVREQERLVLLFTPPFDHSSPNPGYIMGYPPGVRENGGQYTHGSLWLAMARARTRDGDAAVELLQLMNPVESSRHPEDVERYHTEPYVMAADVSSAAGKAGRGGWTWYTGSSAWMYRIWVEEVLGFRLRGDTFTVDPVIPAEWNGFSMTYRYRSAVYEITVQRDASVNAVAAEADDGPAEGATVRLVDDGRVHRVLIRIPVPSAQPAIADEALYR